jgi:lysophospholipid acyltransferase
LMVLVVKLYAFAYNFYDGTVDAARLRQEIAEERRKPAPKQRLIDIYQSRLDRSITSLPNPIEYAGYVLNPVTALSGPAFEISEYLRSQNRTWLPPRYLEVLVRFSTGVAFLAVNAVLQPMMPIETIYTDAAAGTKSFLYRVVYAHISFIFLRCQYFAVWKLAEGACILAGYGYRGADSSIHTVPKPAPGSIAPPSQSKDGESVQVDPWGGIAQVYILKVEFSNTMSVIYRNWNMHTQSWLERYVFLRAPRQYSINKWLTFATSAFWHGTFPGYYMGFLSMPLLEVS